MRQTRLSTRLSRMAPRAMIWIAAFATLPSGPALAAAAPAPLSASETRQLASGTRADTESRLAGSRAAIPEATREEMERLMEAHRKLSVERSRAARARVNRSPAIPDPRKSESAAPFEAADEITVRQVD